MKHGIFTQQLELSQLFTLINLVTYQAKFTFVDLFAGIGGLRIPLEELVGKCLGYSENVIILKSNFAERSSKADYLLFENLN
jgi:hypothetical protein